MQSSSLLNSIIVSALCVCVCVRASACDVCVCVFVSVRAFVRVRACVWYIHHKIINLSRFLKLIREAT